MNIGHKYNTARERGEITSRTVILEGVRRACMMFEGSEERWEALRVAGATNEEIRLQIAYEFGDGGGDLNFRHDGGKNPKVYTWDDKMVVRGKVLVDMVREIFAIPQKGAVGVPVQLDLFCFVPAEQS